MMMPDSGPPPPEDSGPPPPIPLSTFFNIEVAMFQTVKIKLSANGAPVSENATVAAGKPGILRVYVTPATGPLYQGALKCDLELQYPSATKKTMSDDHVLSTVSKDSDLKSTFNFKLGAADLVPDMTFKIAIYDAKRPTNVAAYPSDGTTDSLRVKGYVSDFRIQIVPVHYTANNMDLLPDLSSTQMGFYTQTVLQMYPVANVTLMPPHAPLVWTQPISPGGTGWGELLMAVADLRAQDQPPADVYYMGSFRSMTTLSAYCNSGCILGLSPVPPANDVAGRVSLITGYFGQQSADTLNHELGHALGRGHAPCGGAGGVDPKFPYSGGGVGGWGYDFTADKLVDPGPLTKPIIFDFMSYCGPIWISDYTYRGLYTRISYVRQSAGLQKSVAPPKKMHALSVAHDGSSRWMKPMENLRELPGSREEAHFLDAVGGDLGAFTAGKWELPDLGRNALFLPEPPPNAARVRIGGREVKLP